MNKKKEQIRRMRIQKFDIEKLEATYGIKGRMVCIPEEAAYFGYMIGVLSAGESTRCHRHHEEERFLIVRGEGLIRSCDESHGVSTGDVIELNATDDHSLLNTSKDDLLFTSLWWTEKNGAIVRSKDNRNFDNGQSTRNTNNRENSNFDNQSNSSKTLSGLGDKKRVIISAPPTPNGNLHLGHISGPYLSADIIKRFYTQNNTKCFCITGSDDNQSYVSLKAIEDQREERDVIRDFSKNMQDVFKMYNIEQDIFYKPLENQDYKIFVTDFINKLHDKGWIRKKKALQFYCEHCFHFLFEALLEGKCPYCRQECYGPVCEECGLFNSGTDIIDPICRCCKNIPVLRETQQLYFQLPAFAEKLKKLWSASIMPSHTRALCRRFLDVGLNDVMISHDSSWGINIEIKGFKTQVLDSWIEMAPAYVYASSLVSSLKEVWYSKDYVITLCFGLDNTFCYTTLLPALLMAYDDNIVLPKEYVPNFFYQLEGKKFSKSRNHVIWAKDVTIPIDMLRYYLAYSRPEYSKTNFCQEDLIYLITNDLVESLSPWLESLNTRLKKYYRSISPDAGEWNVEHEQFFINLECILKEVHSVYQLKCFSPSRVISLIQGLVMSAKKLADLSVCLDRTHPHNYYNKLEYDTSVVLELTAAKYYAIICAPIMPNFAAELQNALALPDLHWEREVRLFPKNIVIKDLPRFEHI